MQKRINIVGTRYLVEIRFKPRIAEPSCVSGELEALIPALAELIAYLRLDTLMGAGDTPSSTNQAETNHENCTLRQSKHRASG